jgi:hypothetical protein
MITQRLEELILKGRGAFKTFVAGATQKNTIPIKEDHFIIITDITYFSSMFLEQDNESAGDIILDNMNTQIQIFSDKNYNRFMFRNNFSGLAIGNGLPTNNFVNAPSGSTTLNVYLIHTEAVSITFSKGKNFKNGIAGTLGVKNPANNPPNDYGQEGFNNSLPVDLVMNYIEGTSIYQVNPVNNFGTFLNQGLYKEIAFPVTPLTDIPQSERLGSACYPICHINYVEIKGKPTDLGNR